METREAVLLRLPKHVKERLEELALQNRRSVNREGQVALEHYIAEQR